MGDVSRIEFDGINVSLIDSAGNVITTSTAVSGRPGAQNPSLQNQRNVGPIPEGQYSIIPAYVDFRDWYNPSEWGWENGWGNAMTPLIPSSLTELHGRSGFYLHGSRNGNGYGSAGCIDLNTDDTRILNIISASKEKRIPFIVDYTGTREFLRSHTHPAYSGLDTFTSTDGNEYEIGYGAGQVDPRWAHAVRESMRANGSSGMNSSDGGRDDDRRSPSRFFTSTDGNEYEIGYGAGQVDPRWAHAVRESMRANGSPGMNSLDDDGMPFPVFFSRDRSESLVTVKPVSI